jgi:hypothetical protein
MVEAYWRGLCPGQDIPARNQIDPRGMEDALKNAFLAERIAAGMAKLRVAGTHISDLMGMEMAGMPLSSMIAPEDRDRFGEAVAALFDTSSVVRATLNAQTGFGRHAMEAHLLLLPLRSDFGDVSRALGVLVSRGRIGRTPRRFEVTKLDILPAFPAEAPSTPTASDRPRPPAEAAKPPFGGGLAEDPAPFDPPKGRKGLRLVVSND